MSINGAKWEPVYRELKDSEAEYLKDLVTTREGIAALLKLYNPSGALKGKQGIEKLREIQMMVNNLILAHQEIQQSLNTFAPEDWAAKIIQFNQLYADFIIKTKNISFGDKKTTDLINNEFLKFTRKYRETDAKRQPLNLEGYLIKPTQRGAKYNDLLKAMIKIFPKDDRRITALEKASLQISEFMNNINQAKGSADKLIATQVFEAKVKAYSAKPSSKGFQSLIKIMFHDIEEGLLNQNDVRNVFSQFPMSKMRTSQLKSFVKYYARAEKNFIERIEDQKHILADKETSLTRARELSSSTPESLSILTDSIANNRADIKALEQQYNAFRHLKDIVSQKIKINKLDTVIEKAKKSTKKSDSAKLDILKLISQMLHEQYKSGKILRVDVAINSAYWAYVEKGKADEFKVQLPKLQAVFKQLNKLSAEEISVTSVQAMIIQTQRIRETATSVTPKKAAPAHPMRQLHASSAQNEANKIKPIPAPRRAPERPTDFEQQKINVIQAFKNLIDIRAGFARTEPNHFNQHMAVHAQAVKVRNGLKEKNSPAEIDKYLNAVISDAKLNTDIRNLAAGELRKLTPEQNISKQRRPGTPK